MDYLTVCVISCLAFESEGREGDISQTCFSYVNDPAHGNCQEFKIRKKQKQKKKTMREVSFKI